MDVLKDLFDEKILEIINLFIENSEKKYYLSEISSITKINVASTFRIINKLILKEFVSETKAGKTRMYQLAKNEKTRALTKLLKKDTEPLQRFTEKVSLINNVKKIILESKDKNLAKILIIGNSIDKSKIDEIVKETKETGLNIEFVNISQEQYEGLKNFNYDLEQKIIWENP